MILKKKVDTKRNPYFYMVIKIKYTYAYNVIHIYLQW